MSGELAAGERARLVDLVLRESLGLRAGETVTIETWTHSLGWADELTAAARRIGAHPLVLYESEPAFWSSDAPAVTRAMATLGATEVAVLEASDAWVYLPGPSDLPRIASTKPALQRVLDRWDDQWLRLASARGLRACRLEFAGASPPLAELYGVDLAAWQRELYEGSLVPPKQLEATGQKIARSLAKGRRVTLTHPNGTHLTLGLKGREPVVLDGRIRPRDQRSGRLLTSLPSGVVIVPLDERFAEGTVRANLITRHYRGTFGDAHWTFRDGRLAEATAGAGRGVFDASWSRAGPERARPALFSIGLNPKIRSAPFLEDQRTGVVTVYIGRNADFGGRTRGAYREYAMLDGADVAVDGRPLVSGGRIV
jgi:hypothetical protein